MRLITFSQKDPAEIIPITLDFSALVTQIDSVAITVSVRVGTDASPGSILSGVAITEGGKVKQLIQGGIDGVVYRVRADITSGSEKYSLISYLPIKKLT